MSSGYFDYKQSFIREIAEEIEKLIESNDSNEKTKYGDPVGRHYPPEVIDELRRGLVTLRRAHVYAQRIDWLVSNDDGPETFLERLSEELAEIESLAHPLVLASARGRTKPVVETLSDAAGHLGLGSDEFLDYMVRGDILRCPRCEREGRFRWHRVEDMVGGWCRECRRDYARERRAAKCEEVTP